ncbi:MULTISPECIES: STAS domain-containing protein [Streptomyces]|uniref:STAS domain-containing protein n=1 Tax=Streptomyces gilvifuscus TaxID=1550617 RepID=A0ABT5FZT3_9ACTN|nr:MULTISPECIES: STAS domain-containing protein [Streptomyces]MBK3647764.1 STAS domain-containing protein [Streptomyces sp. MBT33]MDC2958086.1 STAS domain-containing protein [Streptomyces gilvifuscus]
MAADSHSTPPNAEISAADSRQAEVTLTGELDISLLRDLEVRLTDLRLQRAQDWVLNLRGVTRIDLACAYALLRAVTEHSGTTTVRGGRPSVLRTLQHAGLDKAAVIEK